MNRQNVDPMRLARGDYQRALLSGRARWSGSDLQGSAAQYAGRYRRSRDNLLARLLAAGLDADVRDHLKPNGRRMRVLFLAGQPVSATE